MKRENFSAFCWTLAFALQSSNFFHRPVYCVNNTFYKIPYSQGSDPPSDGLEASVRVAGTQGNRFGDRRPLAAGRVIRQRPRRGPNGFELDREASGVRPDVVRPSPALDGGIQTPPGTAGPLPPVGSPMGGIRGGKTDSNSAGRSLTTPLTVSRPT